MSRMSTKRPHGTRADNHLSDPASSGSRGRGLTPPEKFVHTQHCFGVFNAQRIQGEGPDAPLIVLYEGRLLIQGASFHLRPPPRNNLVAQGGSRGGALTSRPPKNLFHSQQ